ncbi:sensor histidine kinase [Flavobacterium sp. JLP]|uniref:sensor histidine kinase n=1 Tax=unclassified Flavobacterium TaxID=196869 RepID=UPI000492FC17|nr:MULTISPECIES: sensor histidine kinase [unclassified Flavobacterium]MBF4506241.1 sensor histidine kinase [Flavobacterium sp. JLP]
MKAKFSLYAKHIVLCLAFLFLPYAFTSTTNVFSLPHLYTNAHDRIYLFIYFTLLCFFYFNYYYLIPKLYFADKKLLYYIIIIVFLLFFLWISTVLDHPSRNFLDFRNHAEPFLDDHNLPKGFPPPPMGKDMPFEFAGGPPTQYGHTTLVYLIGVISSLLFAISGRLQSVEKEKVKSELAFLKAQINPHFLFNTLNSIYALALKKDDKTPDAVVQLSELMRYIMTNSNDEVIDLNKEINYINNFISLQKTRLGNTVSVDYKVTGNAFGKAITPLILISFIENAFKHGVNPDQTSEICVYIDIDEEMLTLFVSNKKTFSVQSDSGIGLQNTIERLSLVYPNKHELKIEDTSEKYIVNLAIKIG